MPASPTDHHFAVKSSYRSTVLQRTVHCVLTVCVSLGATSNSDTDNDLRLRQSPGRPIIRREDIPLKGDAMTISVEIGPEVQAELARQSAVQGRPVEVVAAALLEGAVNPVSARQPAPASAEPTQSERPTGQALIDAFAEIRGLLTDEEIDRKFIRNHVPCLAGAKGDRLLPDDFDKNQPRLVNTFTFYDKKAESAHDTYSRLKLAQIVAGAIIPIVAVVYRARAPYLAVITALLGALVTGIESYIQLSQCQQNWIRWRGSAEALVREAFLFAKRAHPYNDPKTSEAALAENVEAIIAAEQQTWKTTLTKPSGGGQQQAAGSDGRGVSTCLRHPEA
jgi:hypothetical protein